MSIPLEEFKRLHAEIERLTLRERIESEAAVQAAEAAESYRAEVERLKKLYDDLYMENARLHAEQAFDPPPES